MTQRLSSWNPGRDLSRALTTEKIADVLAGSADALSGVPAIGTILSAVKGGLQVRDYLYAQRLVAFLNEFQDASEADRAHLAELLSTPDSQRRFGETILTFIDRADHIDKPILLARIAKLLAAGTITKGYSTMLMTMVDRAFMSDLLALRSFRDGLQRDDATAHRLTAIGLVEQTGIDGGGTFNESQRGDEGGITFGINEHGELMRLMISDDMEAG
jgi:hypothetical protein